MTVFTPAMYDSSRRGHKGRRGGVRVGGLCGVGVVTRATYQLRMFCSQSVYPNPYPSRFAHQKCQSRPKLRVQYGQKYLYCHNSFGNKSRRVTFIECFLPLPPVAFGLWATPPVTRLSISPMWQVYFSQVTWNMGEGNTHMTSARFRVRTWTG